VTLDRPTAGEVHLWWADLALDAATVALAAGALDADEVGRARRMHSRADADRLIARRAVLRCLLGDYLGLAPAEVVLAAAEHGKPFVVGGDLAVSFSASSSGATALYAFADAAPIGVDVECRPDGAWEQLPVRLFLAPDEDVRLQRIAPGRRSRRAAELWTLKEAIAKAVGTGLSLAPTGIELGDDSPAPPVHLTADWAPWASTAWTARIVEASDTRIAAVAVDGPWETTVARAWDGAALRDRLG
jgi:4'-phosphopantetheinyl transferase